MHNHHYEYFDDDEQKLLGVDFNFNGGMDSGEVWIHTTLMKGHVEHSGISPGYTVKVPVKAILELVAYHYVSSAKISRLEQASAKELLLGEPS